VVVGRVGGGLGIEGVCGRRCCPCVHFFAGARRCKLFSLLRRGLMIFAIGQFFH